jgi:CelD/BcsL family acetyltransferase involved in cellulose biosynthesis
MASALIRSKASQLQVDLVTGDAQFSLLASDWNALAGRSPKASVFLRHEWFSAAWAWRRLDCDLRLFVVRTNGALVGVLPLICRRPSERGARKLELLTVPDTQLSDMLAAPTDASEVAKALAGALAGRRDWDLLDLSHLPTDSLCIDTLTPALRGQGLRIVARDGGRNPFIPLSGAWSSYYDTRSRRLKKANNLAANRLKRAGELEVDWIRSDSCAEDRCESAIAAAIAISGMSWKRETVYSLDQPGPQAFVRSLSRAARERGWLSIWIMRVGGRPVAMEYQLIESDNVYALRSDFDASYEETSPGTYLFRHLLESSFGRGLQRYYMGPGDNAYKLRWTNEAEPLQRLIVYNGTLYGRIVRVRHAIAQRVDRTRRDTTPGKEQQGG